MLRWLSVPSPSRGLWSRSRRGISTGPGCGGHTLGGNTDFCHGPLAHPISTTLIPVPPGAYPHWPEQHWAKPNIDEAALALRTIDSRRREIGQHDPAKSQSYREQFSAQYCGARYRQRLEQLKQFNVVARGRSTQRQIPAFVLQSEVRAISRIIEKKGRSSAVPSPPTHAATGDKPSLQDDHDFSTRDG